MGKIIKPECPPSNEFPSRLTRLNLPEWLKGTTVGENEIEIDPIVFSHWVFREVCPKWEDLFLKKAETAMQNSCFDEAHLTLQKDNFLEYFWGNYKASVRTSSLLAWVSDEVLCMDRGEFWKKFVQ